jgi:putative ABC transport system permease protein
MTSYVKTALRNLTRNKTFSFINIFGLAIGTICGLYIIMYVNDHYSYDKHHKRAGDIYRINSLFTSQGITHNNSTSSPPMAPTMKKDFPEVETFTRVVPTNTLGAKQHLMQYGNKVIYETNAVFTDSTFFDVFAFRFIHGNAATALTEPYSLVLLKPVAEKLFGNSDPVGKTISINNGYGKHNFKITGVVDESLGQSHIRANLFMSMSSGGMGEFTLTNKSFAAYNFTASYVRLKSNVSASALEKKLPAFLQRYGADQLRKMGMEKKLHLQAVTSIHTTPGYENELSKTIDSSFLKMLLLIALFIQVIACINFMNLSTARASKRAKEVGVRKVVGAQIKDLVRQFLSESLLLSFCGILIAVPLLVLLLPYLNQITNANISFSFLSDIRFWLLLGGIMVLSGLVSGSFPAFYLSAFKPVRVMKGNFTNHLSAAGLRRALVVFQFVLSILFISAIIIIYSQLNYIKNKDLGFDKNQKLILNFYTNDTKNSIPSLCNDLRNLSEVKAVSQADNFPSQKLNRDWPYFLEGSNDKEGKDVNFIFTDHNYVKALGIKIIGGRDFRLNDSGKVLINETFARGLGLTAETAPGKRLYPKLEPGETLFYLEIAGVMKDINYNSLHNEVRPLMVRYNPRNANDNVIISADSKNYGALLKKIGEVWKQHLPSVPFEYSLLNEDVQQQYKAEVSLSSTINLFTLVAIIISCLGLFGLSAFSAEQRTKEIGIRKALGAGLFNLSSLLSKDYLKLTGIAFIIAIPIAWLIMKEWLQAFSYRVNISWWMFALAGALAMLLTLCTVGFQAIRAAMANPIKSLRTE